MAGNTFIQLPMDVTSPTELRRFLDKLVEQVDIAFNNRGDEAFASKDLLDEVLDSINKQNTLLISIEADIKDIKDGTTILTTTKDIEASLLTSTILCDCNLSNILVTLPDPKEVFISSRSKTISISKIDTSSNFVTILPYKNETIVGESSVDLVLSDEIINLITNGTNWYLGA